ncbi:MAG: DUF1292 domain-containing protein [Schwartzia sp.]|nr:DUF1292 domain-containing protein [Schwartzia sp. (in: firmicutes)]
MPEKEKPALEEAGDEEVIIVMTDDDGNEFYYREEMIIPLGDEKFALLVPAESDEEAAEHDHEGCGCGCEDDDEAFFAKIVLNEDGEEEYIEPSDEEFEAVCKAYDELMDDEEDDE